jgi:hypothetical protein
MPNRKMSAHRLPEQTLVDIDQLVSTLQRRSAGRVSKSDAIAWAVDYGLRALQAAEWTAASAPRRTKAPKLPPLPELPPDPDQPKMIQVWGQVTSEPPPEPRFLTVGVRHVPPEEESPPEELPEDD